MYKYKNNNKVYNKINNSMVNNKINIRILIKLINNNKFRIKLNNYNNQSFNSKI